MLRLGSAQEVVRIHVGMTNKNVPRSSSGLPSDVGVMVFHHNIHPKIHPNLHPKLRPNLYPAPQKHYIHRSILGELIHGSVHHFHVIHCASTSYPWNGNCLQFMEWAITSKKSGEKSFEVIT